MSRSRVLADLGGQSLATDSEVSAAISAANNVVLNAQGGSYTLVLLDSGRQVEMSGGGTLTVPLNSSVAFPVGSSVLIVQTGATQVTVAGAGGVTVNSSNGLKMFGQWSSALLVKRAENIWLLAGDTAP
jgi:hypothetical protein